MSVDPIEALRTRVASMTPRQQEALRRQLEERGIAWERVAPSPVRPAPRPTQLPLTPSQRHFWVQQHLQPGTSAYHIAFAWRFHGPLDVAALERSLQYLVERHEPLRSCFLADDGEPWQKVEDRCALPLGQSDLRAAPQDFAERAGAVVRKPFDLTQAPLMRAHLFQLANDEYALALCIHHMVADGWSRGIFMRELSACYRAFAGGRTPDLEPLKTQYSDLVLKQQDWLASADYQRQRHYWLGRLADAEPQELPTDRPRSTAIAPHSATVVQALPAELARSVRKLASGLGATSFMVLLAAFKLLLHRYTGHCDLAVCVPVAGRGHEEASGLIGLFVNTVVLRTELDAQLSFRGWLNRVRETLADGFEHQDFPFPHLAEMLGFNRAAGQNPLFQIVFQAQTEGYQQQNAEHVDFGVSGLTVVQELLPLSESKAELSWFVMERDGGMSVAAEFRTGLFDASRIERMIGHFSQLLASIVESPDAPIPALDYIPAEEQARIIVRGMTMPAPLPAKGVHEVISETARQYPQAPALECNGDVWNYAALEAAADRLARHLLVMPGLAEPGGRVAVSLPRSAYEIVAFLAILKAGAIYVPLDPRHPAERLAYILDDADVALILTSDAGAFAGRPCLDPATLDAETAPSTNFPATDLSRWAYLLYTSGSTGRPKGALTDHAGLLNHLRAMAREPGLGTGDRMLAVTTVTFDISITEMLLPLTVGATVVLADRDIMLSPAHMTKLLEERGVTHMQATPANWRMLLEAGWEGRAGLTGWVGGEALDAQLAQRLLKRTKCLWNLYGPTETAIWTSALRVEPRHIQSGTVTIGGPIENMQLHVLDAYRQPAPDGIPGELYIGGVGVGPGYWRRPSLTAEKFVPNPFASPANPASRLYQTGDLVSRRADGEINFLGRNDFQIKLRGYRIEIGEIESLLQDEPGVAQALVVLDREHERLVAYCQIAPSFVADKAALEHDLRRRLTETLPRYMVPSAFVLMEAFPLNTNGKVDRNRLPPPDAPQTRAAASEPRNENERALLSVWQEVLKREDIGVEDNFFDLGGDSVMAIRIIARAREAGLTLDPLQMFEHQTVAAQAQVARRLEQSDMTPQEAAHAIALPPELAERGDVEDAYELTPLQAGMLFHSLYMPASGTYFEQCWCLLDGALDVPAFRSAWQDVIARHPVLRSACHWEDLDRPVQVICDRVEPEWRIEDWSELDAAAQEQALDAWLAADRQRSFQFDKAPLLRFALFRLGPDRYRFVFSFHHLLMDGWCGSLIVREVLRAYAGMALPPAPPPYRGYVEWRARQDEAAPEAYWRETLAGLDGPTPLGIGRTVTGETGTRELHQTLPPALSDRLAAMARTSRLTLNTLMQGAWALLLARYSGQDDIVFGAVQSGRPPELPGVETMIGLFLNTVPVRVNAGAGQKLTPWLQALQDAQRQRERFGHAALTDIHRWSGLPAGTALFDSLLIVENYPLSMQGAIATEDVALTLSEGGSYERTHYPLTLKVFPGETVKLSLSFDLARIDPAPAQRLLHHLQVLLEAFAEQPDADLASIELLDAAERNLLLTIGHGPETAPAASVHEQILARAAATPDAMALEFVGEAGETRLTYAELIARSQAVAARLRERGAGPGRVIGVCMDRSPDLVTALLGILTAGAAYLPLDPDYPAERIAYVLADAGCELVLTDPRGASVVAQVPNVEKLQTADCLAQGGLAAAARPVTVTAEDLAYILYTSGSTGRPKGVSIRHGSLANFLQSMAARPGLSGSDRLLAITTVAFDIAGLELFGPLTQGGTLVLTDAASARDGVKLAGLLERKAVTVMQATPAGWRLLVEAGWQGRPGLKMLCGGEALDIGLAQALLERGGSLWNLYGPTETTIWSAALPVEPSCLDGAGVPVGGALDRTQLYVVDPRGAPTPVGVPGELWIAGDGLSPGYWRKPGLTAEKFIPDSLRGGQDGGGMLYRTGDQMRWREDGTLEFLGRMDGQIKLRGHRIELGEIEACLASHPAVAQAIVVVNHAGADPRLIAYLKWKDQALEAAHTVLTDHLGAALPAYMLPSLYVALDAFPLTPNGKIDRRVLASRPDRSEPSDSGNGALALGEPAATLAAIWRDILKVEHIGPRDNFFALGGHSLLVVMVQSAIRQKLGVRLEMVDIFRFPTLETLAGHVAALSQGVEMASASVDRADARARGQQRLRQRSLGRRAGRPSSIIDR